MGDWDASSMTGAMGMEGGDAGAGGHRGGGLGARDDGDGGHAELPPGGLPPGGMPAGDGPTDPGAGPQAIALGTPYELPSLEILPQQSWGKFWQVGGEDIPVMAPTIVNVPKIGHVELEAGVRGGMNAGIEGYFGPGQLRNIAIDLDTGPPPSAAEEVARAATWPLSTALGPTPVGRFQGGAELYVPVDLLAHAGADAAIIGTATHAATGAQVELTGLVAATGQFHWHTHVALPVKITAERSSLTAPWVFSFDAKKRLATSLKLGCDLDAEARAKLQFDLDGPGKKEGRRRGAGRRRRPRRSLGAARSVGPGQVEPAASVQPGPAAGAAHARSGQGRRQLEGRRLLEPALEPQDVEVGDGLAVRS